MIGDGNWTDCLPQLFQGVIMYKAYRARFSEENHSLYVIKTPYLYKFNVWPGNPLLPRPKWITPNSSMLDAATCSRSSYNRESPRTICRTTNTLAGTISYSGTLKSIDTAWIRICSGQEKLCRAFSTKQTSTNWDYSSTLKLSTAQCTCTSHGLGYGWKNLA